MVSIRSLLYDITFQLVDKIGVTDATYFNWCSGLRGLYCCELLCGVLRP